MSDWIEKLKAEPMTTMNRLWPLLCDVVEAAEALDEYTDRNLHMSTLLSEPLAALKAEVEK